MTTVDVLAFGAHPDDVELTVGGTLLRLADLGYRVGIVDMTRGEMATRGTPEIRAQEAQVAAERLRCTVRINLGLPDGKVLLDDHSRDAVIRVLRRCTPALVIAPTQEDLHPDHAWTGRIVKESSFLAGLAKWETGQNPHRPQTVLGSFSHTLDRPSIIVDISQYFSAKKLACQSYASQFYNPGSSDAATYISRPEFWDWWEARARHFGHMIGAQFGEPLVHDGPIPISDPVATFSNFSYYPNARRQVSS